MGKKSQHQQKRSPALSEPQVPGNKKGFALFSSPAFWLKLLIIGQMALLGFQLSPDISTNGDDAVYYILGKSLATGQGYRNIHIVNSPVSTQYPVVFPAFLSLTHLLTDKPLIAKILVMSIGCLVTLCSFYLFLGWIPRSAIPLCFLVGTSAVLNQHSLELLSEIPYILLTLLSLLLLEKSYKNPRQKLLFWLTIIVSIMPMNCRSIGISFSGAFLAANLLNKKYNYVIAHLALVVIAAVLFKMFTSWDNPYLLQLLQRNSYDPEQGFATFSEMFSRIITNISKYTTEILPQASMPYAANHYSVLGALLGIIMALVIVVGCVKNFFLPSKFLSIYAFFYCGILTMWQAQWSSGRFLSGILPVLFYLFFIGVTFLVSLAKRDESKSLSVRMKTIRLPSFLPVPTIAAMLFCFIAVSFSFDNSWFQIQNAGLRKQSSRDWENFNSCADWIRCNTPVNSIVVSRKPELVYLRSRRQGTLYQFSHDKEKVIADIKNKHASYILFDGFFWTGTTPKYLYPALVGHPEMYRMVYALRNPDTFVLEVLDK
jgi:hypothetical protein